MVSFNGLFLKNKNLIQEINRLSDFGLPIQKSLPLKAESSKSDGLLSNMQASRSCPSEIKLSIIVLMTRLRPVALPKGLRVSSSSIFMFYQSERCKYKTVSDTTKYGMCREQSQSVEKHYK